MPSDDTEADLLGEDDISDEDDEDIDDTEILKNMTSQPMWVLPLYSILPSHEQAKVNMCNFCDEVLLNSICSRNKC